MQEIVSLCSIITDVFRQGVWLELNSVVDPESRELATLLLMQGKAPSM